MLSFDHANTLRWVSLKNFKISGIVFLALFLLNSIRQLVFSQLDHSTMTRASRLGVSLESLAFWSCREDRPKETEWKYSKTKRSTSPSHGCFLYLYALNSALMLWAWAVLLHLNTLLKQKGELTTRPCMDPMITRLFVLFLEQTLCFPVIKLLPCSHLHRRSQRKAEDQLENLLKMVTVKGFLHYFHVYIANSSNNSFFHSYNNFECIVSLQPFLHGQMMHVKSYMVISFILPFGLWETYHHWAIVFGSDKSMYSQLLRSVCLLPS